MGARWRRTRRHSPRLARHNRPAGRFPNTPCAWCRCAVPAGPAAGSGRQPSRRPAPRVRQRGPGQALGAGLILSRLAPLAQRIGLSLGGVATESPSAPPAALADSTARELGGVAAAGRGPAGPTARSGAELFISRRTGSVHVSNVSPSSVSRRAARRPRSRTGTACSPTEGWRLAAPGGRGPRAGRDAAPASRPRGGFRRAGCSCRGDDVRGDELASGGRGHRNGLVSGIASGRRTEPDDLDGCWMMTSVGGVAQGRLELR